MIFFKAVNIKDLNNNYVPGTVTNDFNEVMVWYRRYSSKKKNIKGAAKHINRGESAIIKIQYDENKLMSGDEFQRSGVKEHERLSSWTSNLKQKAQINEPVKYTIIDDNDFWKYLI